MIKIVIGKPLADGTLINEEIFVTEERYRQMTESSRQDTAQVNNNMSHYYNRDSNLSRDIDHSPDRDLSGYSARRTGSLFSWNDSDFSEDDQQERNRFLPVDRNEFMGPQSFATQFRQNYSTNAGNVNAIQIGRIVSSWKISFRKTEKDPKQFLLILKDYLSTSGIDRNCSKLFVCQQYLRGRIGLGTWLIKRIGVHGRTSLEYLGLSGE